jgi:hypothetical protein
VCSWNEQLTILERLDEQALAAGAQFLAFKVAPYQCLDLVSLVARLDARAANMVFLFRRNLVRGAVSQLGALELANRSGDTNVTDVRTPVGRVRLQKATFFQQLYELTREASCLKAAQALCRRPHLVIYYEDFCDYTKLHLAGLSAFLGVRLGQADTAAIRPNLARRLRDAVENFDDLCAWLDGTPHAQDLLEDAEHGRCDLPPLQLPATDSEGVETATVVELYQRTAKLLVGHAFP